MIYARLLAVVALFASLWYLLHHADQRGYERAQGEYAVKLAEANATAAEREKQARNRSYEVEIEHQNALSALDARYASRKLPVVRLCPQPASRGELPRAPAAATLDHGAPDRNRLPSRDIGGDLERIARHADEQTARLIACQAYVVGLVTVSPK